MRSRPPAGGRGGAVTVEMAAIISVLVLFLFSVFEYGRYVMIENLLINAVRDGCRYALVHCQDSPRDCGGSKKNQMHTQRILVWF